MKKILLCAALATFALSLPALAADAAAAKASAAPKTLVTINGETITDAMLQQHLDQIPPMLLKGREEELRKGILDRLVEQALIRQEADRMKITQDAEYKKNLDLMQKTLTYNFVIKKKLDSTVTDDAIKAEYEKSKDVFSRPAVKARHILVKTEAEARDVIKKLNEGGDFSKLATELSKDPGNTNGGDLGWFYADDMVKTFADAAFALKKGAYTKEPVKTQFGYHIIMVDERDEKHVPAFDAMEEELRKAMSERTVNEYLAQLKRDAKITYAK